MIAWNHAGNDVTSMMARCDKVVNLVEMVIFFTRNNIMRTDLSATMRCVNTVKPVYNGHSREPGNVPFISSCPLYTG